MMPSARRTRQPVTDVPDVTVLTVVWSSELRLWLASMRSSVKRWGLV
jgi:hypothetical protein